MKPPIGQLGDESEAVLDAFLESTEPTVALFLGSSVGFLVACLVILYTKQIRRKEQAIALGFALLVCPGVLPVPHGHSLLVVPLLVIAVIPPAIPVHLPLVAMYYIVSYSALLIVKRVLAAAGVAVFMSKEA